MKLVRNLAIKNEHTCLENGRKNTKNKTPHCAPSFWRRFHGSIVKKKETTSECCNDRSDEFITRSLSQEYELENDDV